MIGEYLLWEDCNSKFLDKFIGKWLIFSEPQYGEGATFIGGILRAICTDDEVDKVSVDFYEKGIPVLEIKVDDGKGDEFICLL